jgi:hypothetical protein
MYCAKCGNELKDGAQFCSVCGEPQTVRNVGGMSATPTQSYESVESAPPEKTITAPASMATPQQEQNRTSAAMAAPQKEQNRTPAGMAAPQTTTPIPKKKRKLSLIIGGSTVLVAIIALTAFLVIPNILSGGPVGDDDEQAFGEESRGNTVGNIMNGGIATQSDGWVYYVDNSSGGEIHKMRTDGTEHVKIGGNAYGGLNVVDGWVYYINNDDKHIYKMKADGTEREELNDEANGMYIDVVDGWIYCTQSGWGEPEDSDGIYKMRVDGTEYTQLSDHVFISNNGGFNVVGGWIYYTNDDDIIHKIRTDGTGHKKLIDENSGKFNVVDGWIYYINNADGDTIYKMRTDGSERAKLNDDWSQTLNVVDGWVYYDASAIYKMKTDGMERTMLCDYSVNTGFGLNIVDGWIYYMDAESQGQTCSVRIDGTDFEELAGEQYSTSNAESDTAATDNTSQRSKSKNKSPETLYASVLDDYRECLLNGFEGYEESDQPFGTFVDVDGYEYSEDPYEEFGYAFRDIDRNGIDELFIIQKHDSGSITIWAIYAYKDNAPVLLSTYAVRNPCYIDDRDIITTNGHGGAWSFTYSYYRLSSNGYEMSEFEHVRVDDGGTGTPEYYHSIGGSEEVTISKTEFDRIVSSYPHDTVNCGLDFKKIVTT